MLAELPATRQIKGEPRRRWFADATLDLIVWLNPENAVIGFQLCYESGTEKKALTWLAERGYSHKRIDDGEGYGGLTKMTPILVPDGKFNKLAVLTLFQAAAQQLESPLAAFIAEKLGRYPGQ